MHIHYPSIFNVSDQFSLNTKIVIVVLFINDFLFGRYLHHLCMSRGKGDTFGFICPLHIQSKGNDPNMISQYLSGRICDGNKEVYLAPYYHEYVKLYITNLIQLFEYLNNSNCNFAVNIGN